MLSSKLEAIKKRLRSGKGDFVKFETGVPFIFRIMPAGYDEETVLFCKKRGAILDENSGLLMMSVHYAPALKEREDGSSGKDCYVCHTVRGKPCAFCEFVNELGPGDATLAKDLRQTDQCYLLVQDKEDGKVKIISGSSKRLIEELIRVLTQIPNVAHPKRGYWLSATRTGDGYQTKYQIALYTRKGSPVRAPLKISEDNWGDVSVMFKKYVKFVKYERQEQALRKVGRV